MPTAVVIGASRGIGREFARQLLAERWRVFATARDDAALAALRSDGATAVRLDVTRPDLLAGLGRQLKGVELDLALYVAGVYGPPHQDPKAAPTAADFDALMHVNVLGAMQAIALVAPLVAAAGGRFVVISSGMGSIAEAESSHGWLYRVSKAALNMALRSAAFDYPNATMVALNPGWVRTDLGGPNGTLSAAESVSAMRRVIASLGVRDSGTFHNHDGRRLSW